MPLSDRSDCKHSCSVLKNSVSVFKRFISAFKSFFDLLFPRFCAACGRRLRAGEEMLCVHCAAELPLTNMKGRRGNLIERKLWDDEVATERANSFLFYEHSSKFSYIFFLFKYYGRPDVAVHFGKLMAKDLIDTDFFAGIDLLIPVPLTKKKKRQRGYNQSERLAHGIHLVTGIAVNTTAVVRTEDKGTLTHLEADERWDNVKEAFRVAHPKAVAGRHVLIVDDMITTGSTLRALARLLLEAGAAHISVVSLGTVTTNRETSFPTGERP